ncbi:MAG: hypothetical protein MAG451_00730 [Anaerolineales bacterium]|nr:hypothetical protein [Anaerolineales bacterium]
MPHRSLVIVLSYLENRILDRVNDTFWVYLTCYQVLKANHDSRAPFVLATAYYLLQEQAETITDQELRRSFLQDVAWRRKIVKEFAGKGSKDGR